MENILRTSDCFFDSFSVNTLIFKVFSRWLAWTLGIWLSDLCLFNEQATG